VGFCVVVVEREVELGGLRCRSGWVGGLIWVGCGCREGL
jgi:hypothetical protein